jgi:hypothetical protein
MKTPKTPDQLAEAIEALVSSYVTAGREAAVGAMERAFSMPASTGRRRARPAGQAERRSMSPRRAPEEIARLSEQLYELVCAHPGESMTYFAEQTGMRTETLHVPMSKLKAAGRVRSVGQRSLTRYFPAVGRRSRGSEG